MFNGYPQNIFRIIPLLQQSVRLLIEEDEIGIGKNFCLLNRKEGMDEHYKAVL